jgi:hypothetical protein
MSIPPPIRKLLLTVHVVTSVGWLGGAYATLVLIVTGLATGDSELRRAAYLVLRLFDSMLWLPVGALAMVSGVACALLTHWGLVRHYWVALKLVLTIPAFVLPLVFRSDLIQEAVARTAQPGADAGRAGSEMLIPGIVALVILTVATVLSTYKPWGKTPHGRRAAARRASAARNTQARAAGSAPARAAVSGGR